MSASEGTFVPRGTMCLYHAYKMGRSPDIWGEDCMEFRPERWENATPDSFTYPVFHAGPREYLSEIYISKIYVLLLH